LSEHFPIEIEKSKFSQKSQFGADCGLKRERKISPLNRPTPKAEMINKSQDKSKMLGCARSRLRVTEVFPTNFDSQERGNVRRRLVPLIPEEFLTPTQRARLWMSLREEIMED